MKTLTQGLFVLLLVVAFSGCSSNPKDNLEENFKVYSKCMIDKDYSCVAEYTDFNLIKSMGGEDVFIDTMKNANVTIKRITVNKQNEIKAEGEYMETTIHYTQVAEIANEEMSLNSTIQAISKDGGETWFFTPQH